MHESGHPYISECWRKPKDKRKGEGNVKRVHAKVKGTKGKGKERSSPYPHYRPQQVPIGQSVHTPHTVPPPFRPQYGYTQTPIPPPGLAVATPDPSTHYPPILGFETWLQNYRNAFGTEPVNPQIEYGTYVRNVQYQYRQQ